MVSKDQIIERMKLSEIKDATVCRVLCEGEPRNNYATFTADGEIYLISTSNQRQIFNELVEIVKEKTKRVNR